MVRLLLWIVVELKLLTSIMKKIFGILIFILFFVFLAHEVRADYATAYQTYINKTGVYQSAYSDYQVARSNYLASQSLDSQDKAIAATLKMLQARDDVMASYLSAIIAKGDKILSPTTLNTEVNWYNAHNNRLASAGSLNDLVSDSDEAKNEYQTITLPIIYQSIVALGVGNNTYIRGELVNEIAILQAKIDQIKANQDKDVSLIERSLVDVQNKISRSQDKDNSAKNLINSIKPNDNQIDNDFQDAESLVADSNSYLKEANQELLQIITEIKSN